MREEIYYNCVKKVVFCMLLMIMCLTITAKSVCAEDGDVEKEPNSTKEKATSLFLGKSCLGEIGSYLQFVNSGETDIDFYKFEVEKGNTYRIEMNSYLAVFLKTSLKVEFYDESNNMLLLSEIMQKNDSNFMDYQAKKDGVCYLKLYGYVDKVDKAEHYYFFKVNKFEHEHIFDSGVVKIKPSCNSEGLKIYTCILCDEQITKTVPKSDKHNFDSGIIIEDATCISSGTMAYTCGDCGEIKYETISKTGIHLYDEPQVVIAASCRENGKMISVCTICGNEKIEILDKINHVWDEGTIVKQETTIKDGIIMYECIKCGKTKKEIIPKINLRKVKIESVSLLGTKATIQFTKDKYAKEYQARISANKDMSNSEIYTTQKTKYTFTDLERGTTYYIQVCSVGENLSGDKVCGEWSKTVSAEPEEKNAKISDKSLTLKEGKTYSLSVTGTSQKIKWTSDDKKIAKVSSSGVVTAVKAGTTTIIAKVGSKTLKCKVIVEEQTKVTLNKKNLTLANGKSFTLEATITPKTQKKVVWKSSNTSIISVNKNGKVSAKKAGTATITVTVDGVSASCKVTVEAEKPKFSAYLSYNSGFSRYCYLYINNKGSKVLTLGGDNTKNYVTVRPYSNAIDSNGCYWSTGGKLTGVTCNPGDGYGYATIRLEEERLFSSGAAIGFYFVYDGVTYVAATDEYGNLLWK